MEERRRQQVAVKREISDEVHASVFKKAKVWSNLVAQQPGGCIDLDEDSGEENDPPSIAAPANHGPPNPEWDVSEYFEGEKGLGNEFFGIE